MSAAWFGLIGVVVGGLISTLWSWLAVVRQELSDGMVAARLVDEDLHSTELARTASSGVVATPDAAVWSANRVALAKVLGKEQWEAVAGMYRQESTAAALPGDSPGERLMAARAALKPLVDGKRYVVPQRWRNMLPRG